jgi:hypothetical protein
MEYVSFFLAERRGLNLASISEEEARTLELAVNRLVSNRHHPSDEGPDIARLVAEWRALGMELRELKQGKKSKPADEQPVEAHQTFDPMAKGWLMKALERRGLRSAPPQV